MRTIELSFQVQIAPAWLLTNWLNRIIKPWTRTIRRKVPTTLTELSRRQQFTYVRAVYPQLQAVFGFDQEGKLEILDKPLYFKMKVILLYSLLRIPKWVFDRFTKEDIFCLLEGEKLTDFYIDTPLTKNPLPVIRTWYGKKLYGPEDFGPLKAEEFAFADQIYLRYKKTGKSEDLECCLAALYRRAKAGFNPDAPDTDGDIREKFNRHTIERRMNDIARLAWYKKTALLLWYEGARRQFFLQHDKIFDREAAEGSEASTWIEVIQHVAEQGTFGTYKETADTDIYLLASNMNRKMKEHEKMKTAQP